MRFCYLLELGACRSDFLGERFAVVPLVLLVVLDLMAALVLLELLVPLELLEPLDAGVTEVTPWRGRRPL